MRNRSSGTLFVARVTVTALMLTVALTAALWAAQVASKGKVNVAVGLNLRKGPGTQHEILTTMPNGTEVPILGVEGRWYKVTYQSYTGYCYAAYVEVTDFSENKGEDDAQQPYPTLYKTDPKKASSGTIDRSILP